MDFKIQNLWKKEEEKEDPEDVEERKRLEEDIANEKHEPQNIKPLDYEYEGSGLIPDYGIKPSSMRFEL